MYSLRLAHCQSLQQDDEDEQTQVYLFLQQHEVGHEIREVEYQFACVYHDELAHQGTNELQVTCTIIFIELINKIKAKQISRGYSP